MIIASVPLLMDSTILKARRPTTSASLWMVRRVHGFLRFTFVSSVPNGLVREIMGYRATACVLADASFVGVSRLHTVK